MDVGFRTITPLWTGDAWGENRVIMPQSILGSMRYWFDVFCLAAGLKTAAYDGESVNMKEFHEKAMSFIELYPNAGMFEVSMKALAEKGLSLSSIVFGCEGWRGVIGIRSITGPPAMLSKKLGLPYAIAKKRNEHEGKWEEITLRQPGNYDRKEYHLWFFPEKIFCGEGVISFTCADPILKEALLFPLLSFIQDYGFLGGKNNMGFGRVKFYEASGRARVRMRRDEFLFSRIFENVPDIKIKDAVEEVNSFDDLISCDKLALFRYDYKDAHKNIRKELNDSDRNHNIGYSDAIKFLIRKKAEERAEEKSNQKYKEKSNDKKKRWDDAMRHFIFGSIQKDKFGDIEGPNATKIIPWYGEREGDKLECGFVSVCFMKDFGSQRRQ
ncbi:MAG: RAMP superfamily CRISPR-associated protein [Tepidanaerobacteraceae bacterium]|nr:RAMP superfamily CRISPR-associated protein [Tepidanaerobacteraceae bacterium]